MSRLVKQRDASQRGSIFPSKKLVFLVIKIT